MGILTSTSQKRTAWRAWADHCGFGGDYVDISFMGRRTIGGVPNVSVDGYRAMEMALNATGYQAKSVWAYNFRKITGTSKPCTCAELGGCSGHGIFGAVDIDPRQNPYLRTRTFRWSDTKFTPAQIAAVEAIRNTRGEQWWFWGARWNTIKDYMHFEPNIDPRSTAVDWSTVPGTPVIGEEEMLYGLDIGKTGDDSLPDQPAHRVLQAFLVRQGQNLGTWGPNRDGVDGRPGDDTRRGLHNWKISVGVTAALSAGEGKVGDYEMAAIYASGAAAAAHSDSDHTTLATKNAVVAERRRIDKHIADVQTDTPHS